MSTNYDAVENDTGTTLSLTLRDKDTLAALNLTGCSVKLRWRDKTSTIVERNFTIVNPTSGTVTYRFGNGELFAPVMVLEVMVTDALNAVVKSLKTINLNVRPSI